MLPPGITPEQAIAKHSVPNLLSRLHEDLPLQVAEHRGRFKLGKGEQECSIPSVINAVSRKSQYHSNFMEADMSFSSDGVPFCLHEFNLYRTCEIDKKIQDMHSSDVKKYELLIRETEGHRHSDKNFQRTGVHIPTCEEYFDRAIAENPGVTILADGRDGEAGLAVAWLSHRPKYRNNVILLMYTFKIDDVEKFLGDVDAAKPAEDWRETVALAPCVFPEELPRLASKIGLGNMENKDLLEGGKAWINGFLMLDRPEARMRIVAMQSMMSGVTCAQLPATASEFLFQSFRAEEAIMDLVDYIRTDPTVKEIYPHIKISTGTRSYVYSTKIEATGERNFYGISLATSQPKIWEKNHYRLIREGYALPGNAAANADWVISDRWEDDIATAVWKELGVKLPLHWRCPHYDTSYRLDIDDKSHVNDKHTHDEGYVTDDVEEEEEEKWTETFWSSVFLFMNWH